MNFLHLLAALTLIPAHFALAPNKKQKPNIVLLLTDDQDVELGSLHFMPKTLKGVRQHGGEFRHAYVTTPMCCPSRSSLLTGMYVHNHEVFTNKDNCSSPQWQAKHEVRSFATYMSNAGYRTGWREWGGLIMNSKYYNYSINMNGQIVKHGFDYGKDYYTNVIARDGINFIKNSKTQYPNKPFLAVFAFPAPHGPEDSAPQYSKMYFNISTHHTPSYNFAPNPDKQWILRVTGKMEENHKDFTNMLMTKRLQTLQSVDDAVEKVIAELDRLGELESTYVIYTSDHGYHLGQFGLVKGKSFPFEFDVRVPFLIRGPGIKKGVTFNDIVLNIDLAPTFLDLAGIKVPPNMDGRSIVPVLFKSRKPNHKWRDTFLIESSGRRETPHLEAKLHETNLLQYSVPHENIFLNYTELNNDILMQFFKKAHNETNKKTIPFSAQKALLQKLSKKDFDCFQHAKFPCRNGQKWFCQLNNGHWHKYKCKNESADDEPNNKDKECICFTKDGPVFDSNWIRQKRSSDLNKDNKLKYCYCNNLNSNLLKYDPKSEETPEDKIKVRRAKKREEVCHHERMTCFEHNKEHWRTEPKWTQGPFCFCMNANNNTYSCVRSITPAHNFLYCEFVTGFVTFYNLRIDPFQLQNRYHHLTMSERAYLQNLLKRLVSCKGGHCNAFLNTSFQLNGSER
ncbi:extracellular sulfatase SULF-1 homolog isoform X2 [Anthonomus grandis grandis]|uniref:extracellular sulfatase SULF-1 homolog isoform X2 n=1 Tax=Anthonomus grandis grandis TaxID=2921223 RepID=UPI002165DE3B|nr:extracellular sulfatase SULF-1 homolog isoform X2 [Anthonomus grandis grandis]